MGQRLERDQPVVPMDGPLRHGWLHRQARACRTAPPRPQASPPPRGSRRIPSALRPHRTTGCSATASRGFRLLQLLQGSRGGSMRLAGGAGSLLSDHQPLGRGSRVLLGGLGLLLRLCRRRHRPGRPLLELSGALGQLLGMLAGHQRRLLLAVGHRLGPYQGRTGLLGRPPRPRQRPRRRRPGPDPRSLLARPVGIRLRGRWGRRGFGVGSRLERGGWGQAEPGRGPGHRQAAPPPTPPGSPRPRSRPPATSLPAVTG
jgi:hypothetical protein